MPVHKLWQCLPFIVSMGIISICATLVHKLKPFHRHIPCIFKVLSDVLSPMATPKRGLPAWNMLQCDGTLVPLLFYSWMIHTYVPFQHSCPSPHQFVLGFPSTTLRTVPNNPSPTTKGNMMTLKRSLHSSVVYEDAMYVFGGSSNKSTDVNQYSFGIFAPCTQPSISIHLIKKALVSVPPFQAPISRPAGLLRSPF